CPSGGVQSAPEASNPLEVAHRAELLALRSEQARSELQATIEAHQRIYQRMGGSVRSTPDNGSVVQRLNLLAGQLEAIKNRVSAVERLRTIHDNEIRDNVVGQGTGKTRLGSSNQSPPSQPGGPPTKSAHNKLPN